VYTKETKLGFVPKKEKERHARSYKGSRNLFAKLAANVGSTT
jgi:hypothetical protein